MTPIARVIADSIWDGKRITTVEAVIWKPLLAELNTHGSLARSAASSRAIPVEKVIQQVRENPYVPIFTGAQKGMVGRVLDEQESDNMRRAWLNSRYGACFWAESLLSIGCHKEVANRILEPWLSVHVVITGTEWKNFFALRCADDTQPDFSKVAVAVCEAREASVPVETVEHLPFVDRETPLAPFWAARVSAARCARTSYLIGQRPEKTQNEEIDFAAGLASKGHWSPFEHPAVAMPGRHGRFVGWKSYRHTFGSIADTANGDYE